MSPDSKKTATKTPTVDPTPRATLARRRAPFLLLGAAGVALFAGCGGGGGNGNNGSATGTTGIIGVTPGNTGVVGTTGGTGVTLGNASVIGKVTDSQGQGQPGVSVIVSGGGLGATSLSQGGYRLDGLNGGAIYTLSAAVTNAGISYTGSTQVITQSNSLVSNANIILSDSTQQAAVAGIVTNTGGQPVAGVRVFLALPVPGSSASGGNYSSLLAVTDANGHYVINNVPVAASSGIVVAASAPNFANATGTLPTLQPGGVYNQNFTLAASTTQNVNTPSIFAVLSSTEPVNAYGGSARQGHAAPSGSVYEAIRRQVSPAWARLAGKRGTVGKRRIAHLGALGYAVETDIGFDNPTQPGSVLNETVYRTQGTASPVDKTVNADFYDNLADPLASYFTDLSFPDSTVNPTSANVQYNYALTATNTDGSESLLSQVFSVVPLPPLTLTQPTPGQSSSGTPTISWTQVTGVTSYFVYIYDQFPTIGSTQVFKAEAIPASNNSITLNGPNSLRGGGVNYYAVVVGVADQTESTNPTTGQPVKVPNAVFTFSPITRFIVP